MDTTTKYNLDDIFYSIDGDMVSLWVVNNILTSAVGGKIIYELKNAHSGKILDMEEPLLQSKVDSKAIVLNTDDLKKELDKYIDKIINGVKKIKKDFMKSKLNRTLHGTPREADTTWEHIKEGIKRANNNLDEEREEKDISIELDEVDKEIQASKTLAENMLSDKWAKYWTSSLPKYRDDPF